MHLTIKTDHCSHEW